DLVWLQQVLLDQSVEEFAVNRADGHGRPEHRRFWRVSSWLGATNSESAPLCGKSKTSAEVWRVAPPPEELGINLSSSAAGRRARRSPSAHCVRDRKSTRLNSSHVKSSY